MSIMPSGFFDWLSAVSVTLAAALVKHVLSLNTRFQIMEALREKTDATVIALQSEQAKQNTELVLHKEKIEALKTAVDNISDKLNGITEKTSLLPVMHNALSTLQGEFRWLRDKEGSK